MTQLYVLYNSRSRLTKIGISKDTVRRVRQLSNAAGTQIDVMLCIEHPYAFEVEQRLHKKYSHYRTTGEWFDIDPTTVVTFIEANIDKL